MATESDYRYISRESLDRMLDAPGTKLRYEPRGVYICLDEVDGQNVYTAVDNSDGLARTEDFVTKRSAVRWLHGHPVTAEQYWRPAGEKRKMLQRLAARLDAEEREARERQKQPAELQRLAAIVEEAQKEKEDTP